MAETDSKSGLVSRFLSRWVSSSQDRGKSWYTPWSWVTSDRLYIGEDGAWLYRALPNALLDNEAKALQLLLAQLAESSGRQVHIVLHTWSVPAGDVPNLPEALIDIVQPALQLPHPVYSGLIGVKLQPEQSKVTVTGGLVDTVDQILGETVPEPDEYEHDLAAVDSILTQYGAVLPTQQQIDHLEYWYTLGSPSDPNVTEMENTIEFGGVSTLTSFTVDKVPANYPATSLPGSGNGTSAVVSVRGTACADGVNEPSVVLSRRSSSFTTWEATLAESHPHLRLVALPMRQLPAMSETLPSSRVRVNPQMESLSCKQLQSLGVTTETSVGDGAGLLLGMGGPEQADRVWWNPLDQFGNLLSVTGDSGSGKTFLLEYLSLQALAAGIRVRYVTLDAESGRPLVESGSLRGVASPLPGLGNPGPFRYETVQDSLAALAYAAVPQVDRREWQRALSRVQPSNPDYTHDMHLATEYLPGAANIAHIKKSSKADTLAKLLFGDGQWPSDSVAVSLPHVLSTVDPAHRAAAAEALCASALNVTDTIPTLVVVDGDVDGRVFTEALARLEQIRQPVGVVTAGKHLQVANEDRQTRLLLSEREVSRAHAGLDWLGLPATYSQLSFVTAELNPVLSDQAVEVPARGLIRDRRGRNGTLSIGPLRDDDLTRLSRGSATHYIT